MDDLDPAKATSLDDLAACLRHVRLCADQPAYRALEQQSLRIGGLLPGTRLKRARLTRSTVSEVLRGRKFPSKAFLLTFVDVCGVDLENDPRWGQAWDRIAPQYQASMEIGEADKLRLENEELRQQLAAAERQAEAARGQTQGQLSGHLAAADERAGATGPPGKAERLRQENEGPRRQLATATWQAVLDPDVIQQGLDVTPWSQMRSLTELRRAIEPPAAFLAAQRASADVCRDLVILSRQLQELGKDGRFRKDSPAGRRIRADYQDVDARFHQALLKGSQNEMFYALKDPVRQALSYRIHQKWEGARGPGSGVGGTKRFPPRPVPLALWLHRGLAAAVEQRQPEAAETFSRAILAEIGTDPLPLDDGIALEHALALLDPGSMDADGAGWERFQHTIWSAILPSRAAAAALGPVVVMGVAGCGKTTIGQLLADCLHVPYAEADSFHPAINVSKMAEGDPLTDQDRGPWLEAIADRIRQDSRAVMSCSALKRAYRDVLRQACPRTWFLHLAVDQDTAAGRVAGRATHFMPASLVDSQFKDLEPLTGEAGLTVDSTLPPKQIIAIAIRELVAAADYALASAHAGSGSLGMARIAAPGTGIGG